MFRFSGVLLELNTKRVRKPMKMRCKLDKMRNRMLTVQLRTLKSKI
jgi:hypothetical protein